MMFQLPPSAPTRLMSPLGSCTVTLHDPSGFPCVTVAPPHCNALNGPLGKATTMKVKLCERGQSVVVVVDVVVVVVVVVLDVVVVVVVLDVVVGDVVVVVVVLDVVLVEVVVVEVVVVEVVEVVVGEVVVLEELVVLDEVVDVVDEVVDGGSSVDVVLGQAVPVVGHVPKRGRQVRT